MITPSQKQILNDQIYGHIYSVWEEMYKIIENPRNQEILSSNPTVGILIFTKILCATTAPDFPEYPQFINDLPKVLGYKDQEIFEKTMLLHKIAGLKAVFHEDAAYLNSDKIKLHTVSDAVPLSGEILAEFRPQLKSLVDSLQSTTPDSKISIKDSVKNVIGRTFIPDEEISIR
jgi:hypothetical protein